MSDFALFVVVTVGWASLARLVLDAGIAHPLAIGAVWLVGFVWFTAYIAGGLGAADRLVKVWLGWLAGVAVLASVGAMVLS